MRFVITVLSLALLASAAVANPLPVWPAVSLTFADNGAYEPEIYPAPGSNVTAYLMVTCGLGNEGSSLAAISFAIGYTGGALMPIGYTSLISDVVITGYWETGITLVVIEPIMTSQVPVARLDFLYVGGPAFITVEDHPQYPRSVIAGDGGETLTARIAREGHALQWCVRALPGDSAETPAPEPQGKQADRAGQQSSPQPCSESPAA